MRAGHCLHVVDGLSGRERSAIPASQRRLAVLRIDRVGDEPGLGALQRFGVDSVGHEFRQHLVDRRIQRRQRDFGRRHRIEIEAGVVERRTHVIGARADGFFLLENQRAIEQARLAAAQEMGEHLERRGFARRGRARRGRQIAALPARLLDLFVVDRDEPARDRFGLARPSPLRRLRRAGGSCRSAIRRDAAPPRARCRRRGRGSRSPAYRSGRNRRAHPRGRGPRSHGPSR